jgi:TPR repeat protein
MNYKKASKWYKKAAKQGHAEAQYNLGIMYYNGRGVDVNYKKAIEWYEKAAEQGLLNAQSNLGVMYQNGQDLLPPLFPRKNKGSKSTSKYLSKISGSSLGRCGGPRRWSFSAGARAGPPVSRSARHASMLLAPPWRGRRGGRAGTVSLTRSLMSG